MEQKTLTLTFLSLAAIFDLLLESKGKCLLLRCIDRSLIFLSDLTVEKFLLVIFFRYPLLAAPVSLVLLPLLLGKVASQGQGVSVLASSLAQPTEYTHRTTLMATNLSLTQ